MKEFKFFNYYYKGGSGNSPWLDEKKLQQFLEDRWTIISVAPTETVIFYILERTKTKKESRSKTETQECVIK